MNLIAKLVTLGLLKLEIFLNIGYDVITSVLDITNEVISPESNYTLH